MAIDWKAMLHNKPLLAAAGVAGAAGVYVLIKRQQSTGSTSAPTAGGSTPSGIGFPDTTGTDLAQYLGQYGASIQNQLDAYQQQLNDTLTAAGLLQSDGTGTAPPPSGSRSLLLPDIRRAAGVNLPPASPPPVRSTLPNIRPV